MELVQLKPLTSATATMPSRTRSTRSATEPADPGGRLVDREAVVGTVIAGETTTRLRVPADVRLRLVQDAPTTPAAEFPTDALSEAIRRGLNVLIALVAVVLLAPVMLAVAIAVKLSSPGPVFYTQQRVGQDRRQRRPGSTDERRHVDLGGRLFTIYKFRSMRTDAEADGRAVWARQDDDRVTSVGRVIRRTRLDELPQLFNVLRGDMNIVGPRPERPCIFAELRASITEYPLRQLAKPGITGWAQINHTYDTCLDDVRTKVRYDLEYLSRQSALEDIKIMALTIPVMIRRQAGW